MNKNNVETVKQANDIVAVIGDYVDLSGAGKWYRGRCPFHNEKTPSFYVSPDRGRYKCFGCGVGGDVITFIQEIEKITFSEAVQLLADKAGIVIAQHDDPEALRKSQMYEVLQRASGIYSEQLQKHKAVIAYLNTRGVIPEIIQTFGIGFAPDNWNTITGYIKNSVPQQVIIDTGMAIQGKKGMYDRFRSRLMFPIHDVSGRVVGFSGRLLQFPGKELQTEQSTSGKYINSPESVVYHKSEVLFGLHIAKYAAKAAGRIIITEGQFDCVLSHQIGFSETIAISGTALTEKHAALIARFTDTAILALDGDSAGIKALSRSLPHLYAAGIYVQVAKLPKGQDPADIIRTDPQVWKSVIDNAQDYIGVRLQLLQEEESTDKAKQIVLQSEIYPLVFSITNPIYRDKIIQKIAAIMSVSTAAIEQDLSKSVTRSDISVSPFNTYSAQEQNISSSKELLLGIIGVFEEEKNPIAAMLLGMIQEVAKVENGVELANTWGIQYDDAVFTVSAQYASASLETHGKAAALLVLQEYLRQTRDTLAQQLSRDQNNQDLMNEFSRVVARIDEVTNQFQ